MHRVEFVMGMAISIDVRDPDVPASAVEEVVAWFHEVDRRFSTYQADSEISRLDRGEITLAACHPDVREVLDRCEQLRIETDGYFDARANEQRRLDPSGLVKGWSVERASRMLAERGSRRHCINAGGDVRVRGEPQPGRPWRVGIVHPFHRDALTTVVCGADLAVATSGVAERGLHVFDPHSGRPVAELASVTLVGVDLASTDAYATAAMAMGLDAPGWLSALTGYEAYVIDATSHVWMTEGFRRYQPPPVS